MDRFVRVHFYFLGWVLLLLLLRAVGAAHNVSTEQKEVPPTVSSFSVTATTINTFLCVYSIAVAAVEKGYAFLLFDRGAAAAANHFSC